MIAAVLHFKVSAAPATKSGDHVRSRLADRGDVVDLDPRQIVCGDAQKCLGSGLLGIADHEIGLVHLGESFRLDLGRAAGDDDLRGRPLAANLAHGLTSLPDGFGSHGASVDDHGIVEPGRRRVRLCHFAFVSVQAAAKGDDVDAHDCRATSTVTPLPFKWIIPLNSNSAGPVIKI